MDMRKYSGETYLKPDDVRAGQLRRVITRVKVGNFERPELIFDDQSILSLNITNTRTLRKNYGDESEGWVGREVELRLGSVQYQGDAKESVVITPISPPLGDAERQVAQERAAAANHAEMDDKIPF